MIEKTQVRVNIKITPINIGPNFLPQYLKQATSASYFISDCGLLKFIFKRFAFLHPYIS